MVSCYIVSDGINKLSWRPGIDKQFASERSEESLLKDME